MALSSSRRRAWTIAGSRSNRVKQLSAKRSYTSTDWKNRLASAWVRRLA